MNYRHYAPILDAFALTQEAIEVFDHDWASLAQGVAIPHGLYDLTDNVGYIQSGTSHAPSEFACDSIRYWWKPMASNAIHWLISFCCSVMQELAIARAITSSSRTYRRWSMN